MRRPAGLQPAGRSLWDAVVADLPRKADGAESDWELDKREEQILKLAARQADDVARLERAIAANGTMVIGSTGQPVLNPAIAEARQARAAVSRLVGTISIPDHAGDAQTFASRRGQEAANSRWGKHRGAA